MIDLKKYKKIDIGLYLALKDDIEELQEEVNECHRDCEIRIEAQWKAHNNMTFAERLKFLFKQPLLDNKPQGRIREERFIFQTFVDGKSDNDIRKIMAEQSDKVISLIRANAKSIKGEVMVKSCIIEERK